jgi:Domain of unknown function (DUF4760)
MRKNSKLKWGLLAGLLLIWLVGVIGVGMSVYYNPAPGAGGTARAKATTAEVVSSVFTVLGGLSVILTLYFNIWQSIETNERQIIENTFHLLRSWDDPALLTARKFTRELGDRQNQLSPEQLIAEVNKNPDLRQSVVQVFNFIEHVGFSIRTGRVDAPMVRHAISGILTAFWQRLLPWVEHRDKQLANFKKDLEDHIDLLREPRKRA